MGQKINPISLRLQNTNRYFDFCWYNDFFYSDLISQDLKIENYLGSIFKQLHYPLGRFFIQNSQKKIKIFAFFCSPKKSRKKKGNFFKLNYYKKNIYNLKNTKISAFLREEENLQYLQRSIISHIPIGNDSKKNIGVYVKTTQKKVDKINFEEKLIYMNYLLYRYYLQRFYRSKESTSFLPNWISFLKKKQEIFYTKSKNLKTSSISTFISLFNQKEILSYNKLKGFDLKNINNLLSYQSDYLQVNIVNNKLKKSKTLALTALEKKNGHSGQKRKDPLRSNDNRKSTKFKGKFWNKKKIKN